MAMDFEEKTITTRASSQLIETILEALDQDYTEIGNNAYLFKVANRYKVILSNYGEDIRLYAAFDVGRVTLSRINEWNRRRRFSSAYLDRDNDPVLQADLDFEGGVTGETILRFIAIFTQSVEEFAQHIQ